jgi:hypothetical protein
MLWLSLVSLSFSGTSQLWGAHGELFDPLGRLPDFSYAGYHAGEQEIPFEAVTVMVGDFGAHPNDGEDDTVAIQAAIDQTDQGVIGFEAGRYELSGVIYIRKSHLVLRGAGQESTTLYFSKNLSDALGYQVQWSWEGGMIWIATPDYGSTLSDLIEPGTRGDRSLALVDTSGIAPGQMVALNLVDDEERSLGRHLHNDQEDAGTCSYQLPLKLTWPVQVLAVDGNRVELKQPLRVDARLEWSPTLSSAPYLQEVGIEQLRIEFKEEEYAGHLLEPGYNAIYYQSGVFNSWVQNVTVAHADTAIGLDDRSKWITVRGVTLEGRYGHHGFNVSHTADCLFEDIQVNAEYRHTFSIEHRATGSVLSRAKSELEFTIDHHRDGAFENLFTEIDAPVSHYHGGNFCAGWPAGARETFWNNRAAMPLPYWGHIQTNLVGALDMEAVEGLNLENLLSADREWYENVDQLEPENLYESQLSFRLYGLPDLKDTGLTDETDSGGPDKSEVAGCSCSGAVSLQGASAVVFTALVMFRRRRVV